MKINNSSDQPLQRRENNTPNTQHAADFSTLLAENFHAEGSEEMQSRVHKEQVLSEKGLEETKLRVFDAHADEQLMQEKMNQQLTEREHEERILNKQQSKENADAQKEALEDGFEPKTEKKQEKDLQPPTKSTTKSTTKTNTSKNSHKTDAVIDGQAPSRVIQTSNQSEQLDSGSNHQHQKEQNPKDHNNNDQ